MTDRLTLDGFRRAVSLIEDHWPTRTSKWHRADAVYPTFARYADHVVIAAARQLITTGSKFQPSPADLRQACELEVRRLIAERAAEAGKPGHPRGCVWGIYEDRADGMSVIGCVICLDEKIVPTGTVRQTATTSARPADRLADLGDPLFG